jgi:hypothetical protein
MILLVIFLSPGWMAAIQLVAFVTYQPNAERPSGASLVRLSIKYAFVGASLSLALTIAWMIIYEATTGFSAGNGPLGWIFIYGPASVACGQLVALVRWWSQHAESDAQPAVPADGSRAAREPRR